MKRRTRPDGTAGDYGLEGGGAHLVADEQRQEGDGQRDRERPERDDSRGLTALHTGKCCADQFGHR